MNFKINNVMIAINQKSLVRKIIPLPVRINQFTSLKNGAFLSRLNETVINQNFNHKVSSFLLLKRKEKRKKKLEWSDDRDLSVTKIHLTNIYLHFVIARGDKSALSLALHSVQSLKGVCRVVLYSLCVGRRNTGIYFEWHTPSSQIKNSFRMQNRFQVGSRVTEISGKLLPMSSPPCLSSLLITLVVTILMTFPVEFIWRRATLTK